MPLRDAPTMQVEVAVDEAALQAPALEVPLPLEVPRALALEVRLPLEVLRAAVASPARTPRRCRLPESIAS